MWFIRNTSNKITDWIFKHSTSHESGGTDAITKLTLTQADPVTLTGSALVYLEIRPDLDYDRIIGNTKPTRVIRGIIEGWSLPIYAADEELYFNCCVPDRWEAATDITVHCHCYLDAANTDKKFNLRLEWEHFTVGDVVPDTDNDVPVETDTGAAAQYKSFEVTFTIDYDIDTPDDILADDNIHLRLRRIDASANEIAGEVVVTHLGIVYQRNKIGSAV